MNERSESMAILSFNPATDFELWAMESELIDAEIDLCYAEEAFVQAFGYYGEDTSLESFFDCMFDGSTAFESENCDNECDDEDDEDDDDELPEGAVEAYIALEAANETFGERLKRWWTTLKNKFLGFLKKITESVANMTRAVQIKFASRGFKDSDIIRVDEATWTKADVAIKQSKQFFNTINAVLNGKETVASITKLRNAVVSDESIDAGYTNTKNIAKKESPVGNIIEVKFGKVKEALKSLSGMIKSCNMLIGECDRFVSKKGSVEIQQKQGDNTVTQTTDVRETLQTAVSGMTSVVRAAFTGLMGALKQTRKENKEGKNEKRNLTSSEQSNAKSKPKTGVISKAQQKKNAALREELLEKRGAKLEEAKKTKKKSS